MEEPSYYQMHRLKITDWRDAPGEYNYWGAGDPMEIDKGDLQHMMKGFLLNYSDDGEYGHYLRLSKDAIEWLKGLNDAKNLSNIANEFNAKQAKGLIAMLENQRITDQAIAIVKYIENYKNTVGDPRYDAGLQAEVAGFVLAHDMTPGEWLSNHISD